MASSDPAAVELAKLEFEAALTAYAQATTLRRQDMAFITTVQGAVLTIVGDKLLNLDVRGALLSAIAMFTLLMGLNTDRRLNAYMRGYMQRAKGIEAEWDMHVLSTASESVGRTRGLVRSSTASSLYYILFIIAWVVIWNLNLW